MIGRSSGGTRPQPATGVGASVDRAEIAKFAAMAEAWWDPHGAFRPLHRLNPTRIGFIRDRVAARHGRDPLGDRPLAGLRLIDIGCGGGLLAEPMARLGATVVGVDAAERNIAIARLHAAQSGLAIDYREGTAEDVAAAGDRFDVVLAMEVIEHVADRDAFLGACCELAGADGMIFIATLNRTAKAFALAIVGAEYLLRWLPRGTHEWRRFVRPAELAASFRRHGVATIELAGVSYNPLADKWSVTRDLDVNYMAVAGRRRPASG
ncbi:MAG: bifunctional 2-polyprenyl-6-hydroxyphenol methylase/3-demethylubiquinol 3-O-methyltransferase UbiG [Dongiaceae bacterium]